MTVENAPPVPTSQERHEGAAEGPSSSDEAASTRLPASGSRLVQWFPLAVVAAVPALVVFQRRRGVGDPDAYWHVLGGQHLVDTWSVVFDDPYGHFSTNEWVQIDWLSDWAVAMVYAVGGISGVWWFYTVAIVLAFLAVFRLCRERSGILVATVVGFVAWLGMSGSLTERSQVFSFVFLAVTLTAWARSARDHRLRWYLIPLTWLWTCIHGFWFMGPVVGVVVIAGLLLDRSVTPRGAATMAVVPAASVVAACLTPLGLKVLSAPLTVNSYASLVSEYSPPDIHHPAVAATTFLLAITALGWAGTRQERRVGDMLMWLLALALAVLYSRTVALGAVIVAPIAAAQVQLVLKKSAEPFGRLERHIISGTAVFAVVLAALTAPALGKVYAKPTQLDAELRGLPEQTVVLNDDALGGWLLLEYPELRPVADTRTYLFTFEYLSDYKNAGRVGPGWQEFVRGTGATAALLPAQQPLTAALQDQLGWDEVGSADGYVLLQAP